MSRRGQWQGPGQAGGAADGRCGLTVVVLSPHDPMTRGQLRRVAELARDEGVHVRWEDARGGPTAPLKTVGSLVRELRRARRVVIGDPFSRYVQLLLTLTTARDVVVVDDGTATMEFVSQLAGGERLVRWHRKGSAPAGPHAAAQAVLFAPFARRARARLTPGSTGRNGGEAGSGAGNGNGPGTDGTGGAGDRGGPGGGSRVGTGGERDRRVEIFSSMPVDASDTRLREMGVAVTANDFAWTRSRFGPPRLTRGTDLVGTSLVETGVVDLERYLEGVAALARTHGATRYFAHRRESSEKLHRVKSATGLEIVRPDLPLELVARRGPIGRTVVSFPSTVVHTLPLALAGTPVSVAVCEVDRTWFTPAASPRAEGFLTGVTDSARRVRRLGGTEVPGAAEAVTSTAAGTEGTRGPAEPSADSAPATASGTPPGTGTGATGGGGTSAAGNGTTASGQTPEPRAQRPSRTSCRKEAGRASA
ncbi:hypothetical protein [Streptomyces marispadix]|uniref:Uncharacterized protein n=1 Tax=Streptomyces marispadix TaxID=2922868 RepID=A0ABS9T112_9ACTN|nr:hypothetical protein [Streptomyces marispadix]MCH6162207.1 hypothetical protein [Streptomyces marispadix]